MLYDTLIVIALQIVATVPFLPLMHGHVLVASEVGSLAYVYRVVQIIVWASFFVFFWTRKGRTLGMQAWRLHIQSVTGALPSWRNSLARLGCALLPWLPAFVLLTAADYFEPRKLLVQMGAILLGLGFLNYAAAWFDLKRRSWHDRLLTTRIIKIV